MCINNGSRKGRNIASYVALSALVIKKYYEDAIIVVVPSEHLIVDEEKYLKIISIGEDFVNKNSEPIVTLGITPDRVETGYEYIKIDKYNNINNTENYQDIRIHKIEKFVEKPNIEVAQEYLKDGNYLWKADHILKLTKK